MTRISPAPWKSEGRVVYDANHHLIGCFVIEEGGYDNAKHDKANARLASKVPELLTMVKDMADELRKHEKWCARDHELCRKCGKEETCLIIKADELIAEAEGRETCLKR